jgi:hypothetical protein
MAQKKYLGTLRIFKSPFSQAILTICKDLLREIILWAQHIATCGMWRKYIKFQLINDFWRGIHKIFFASFASRTLALLENFNLTDRTVQSPYL